MLENCKRFLEKRCNGGGWKSYAELESELSAERAKREAAERRLRQHLHAEDPSILAMQVEVAKRDADLAAARAEIERLKQQMRALGLHAGVPLLEELERLRSRNKLLEDVAKAARSALISAHADIYQHSQDYHHVTPAVVREQMKAALDALAKLREWEGKA